MKPTLAMLAALPVAATLFGAGTASADPAPFTPVWEQKKYVDLLAHNGINGQPDELLKLGYAVCHDWMAGTPIVTQANAMQRDGILPFQRAEFLIAAAGTFLCPGPKPVD